MKHADYLINFHILLQRLVKMHAQQKLAVARQRRLYSLSISPENAQDFHAIFGLPSKAGGR